MFRCKGGNLFSLSFTELERHQPGGRLNSLAKDAASEPPRVSRRLHSSGSRGTNGSRLLEPLGYMPPAEFEKAYHDRQAAPVGMAVLT